MIRFSDDQKREPSEVSALKAEIERLKAEITDLREVIRECLTR